VFEYEASKHMPYITSIEEMGRQEGRQEGLREGVISARQKAVLDALEVRFGEAPESLRQKIEATQDEDWLRSLYRSAIQTDSIEAFARELKA
jgi:predicted transposase YdaD